MVARRDRPLAAQAWLRAPASRRVLAALGADGHEARFVGGCVRDWLLDHAKTAGVTPRPVTEIKATEEEQGSLERSLREYAGDALPGDRGADQSAAEPPRTSCETM